jgi:50S ribosome-binding GTPase
LNAVTVNDWYCSGLQVAIVGRPNVGKSTLFNRLVRRRKAIVGNPRFTIADKFGWPISGLGHLLLAFEAVDGLILARF